MAPSARRFPSAEAPLRGGTGRSRSLRPECPKTWFWAPLFPAWRRRGSACLAWVWPRSSVFQASSPPATAPKTKPVPFFPQGKRPAGIGFSAILGNRKAGSNRRRKATAGRWFGRGLTGGGGRGPLQGPEGDRVGRGGQNKPGSLAERFEGMAPWARGANLADLVAGGGPGRCPPLVNIVLHYVKAQPVGGEWRRAFVPIMQFLSDERPCGRGSRPRRSQGRAAPGPEGGGNQNGVGGRGLGGRAGGSNGWLSTASGSGAAARPC